MAWGGTEEQKKEQEAGNAYAKNWCDEALKIVERTMDEYWNSDPIDTLTHTLMNTVATIENDNADTLESDFDRHRRLLLTQSANSRAEGWAMELRRYLGDLPADVTKDMNIVNWWAVSTHFY